MTENEAIERIKYRIKTATDICGKDVDGKVYEDMEIAINALQEIQQYRSIGTPDEIEGLNFSSNQLRLVNLVEKYKEKLKEYEKIGTVSKCKKAIEKQKPKIPNIWGDGYVEGQLVYDMYDCPNCDESYEIDYDDYDYCPKCGQRIDKSDLYKIKNS